MARSSLTAILLLALLCLANVVNAVNTPSWHPRGAKRSSGALATDAEDEVGAGEDGEDAVARRAEEEGEIEGDAGAAEEDAQLEEAAADAEAEEEAAVEAAPEDEAEPEEAEEVVEEEQEEAAEEEEAAERKLLQDDVEQLEDVISEEDAAAASADEDLGGAGEEDMPDVEQVDENTLKATAEDTGEEPVGPSNPELESEIKAATEEKLREEEDENNLPHGTPSWHPARVHKHDGEDEDIPEEAEFADEAPERASEEVAVEDAAAEAEMDSVTNVKRLSRRMLLQAPNGCPQDRFLLGEC